MMSTEEYILELYLKKLTFCNTKLSLMLTDVCNIYSLSVNYTA